MVNLTKPVILPDIRIVYDGCKAGYDLGKEGYAHDFVNNLIEFVDVRTELFTLKLWKGSVSS